MIVNVRGTHGAGKTYLVRKVMRHYGHHEPIYIDGRRHPIGYVCSLRGHRSLFVCGHYEGDASGGCDTIPSTDLMFKFIRRYAKRNFHVLYEGIVAQHSTPNAIRLNRRHDVRVVLMRIPLRRSLRSIKRRRRKRGETKPFNPTNAIHENTHRSLSPFRIRGDGLRLYVFRTRRESLRKVLHLFDL